MNCESDIALHLFSVRVRRSSSEIRVGIFAYAGDDALCAEEHLISLFGLRAWAYCPWLSLPRVVTAVRRGRTPHRVFRAERAAAVVRAGKGAIFSWTEAAGRAARPVKVVVKAGCVLRAGFDVRKTKPVVHCVVRALKFARFSNASHLAIRASIRRIARWDPIANTRSTKCPTQEWPMHLAWVVLFSRRADVFLARRIAPRVWSRVRMIRLRVLRNANTTRPQGYSNRCSNTAGVIPKRRCTKTPS